MPYPLDEVNIDFEKLAINEADPSKVNVLLSAARTESVFTITQRLNSKVV
ncbi:MAG: pilus assembly protein PilM [Pseudomonadota bacterium]